MKQMMYEAGPSSFKSAFEDSDDAKTVGKLQLTNSYTRVLERKLQ